MLPFRRLSSALVLVAWLIGLVAPAVTAHADIDLECGDAIWLSDHHRTAFEEVLPSVDTGHCDLCHLQRALRGAESGSGVLVAIADHRDVAERAPSESPRSTDRSGLPPRAPPADLG
jgi:hypothetical protein